jgi:hypothetical protein
MSAREAPPVVVRQILQTQQRQLSQPRAHGGA